MREVLPVVSVDYHARAPLAPPQTVEDVVSLVVKDAPSAMANWALVRAFYIPSDLMHLLDEKG